MTLSLCSKQTYISRATVSLHSKSMTGVLVSTTRNKEYFQYGIDDVIAGSKLGAQ